MVVVVMVEEVVVDGDSDVTDVKARTWICVHPPS